jgi:dTDP-4-dehydrorhamnose 3,5-epimerase
MLRCDPDGFQGFSEIFFCVNLGAIKGWHIHKEMVMNYAVPHGNIKFVLYDNRPSSLTQGELQEVFLGPDSY